jgi:hypothetical protein
MCESTSSLPVSGGLLEQDCFLMEALISVRNLEAAKAEDERKKEEQKRGHKRP